MTPKEKAMHIFNKMCNSVDELLPLDVKECAIIAVDEIIELYEFHAISDPDNKRVIDTLNYFDEVKKEIEKL